LWQGLAGGSGGVLSWSHGIEWDSTGGDSRAHEKGGEQHEMQQTSVWMPHVDFIFAIGHRFGQVYFHPQSHHFRDAQNWDHTFFWFTSPVGAIFLPLGALCDFYLVYITYWRCSNAI
jgi:hypothetical protein